MRREVFTNIIRFKDALLQQEEWGSKPFGYKRAYPTLINRQTGAMRFAQKIGGADWQKMQLAAEEKKGRVHFYLNDGRGKHAKSSQFDPLAWKIVSETLKAMDAITAGYSAHEILSDTDRLAGTPGWIPKKLPRIAAENMLLGKRPGTYLITNGDEMIEDVARCLAEANGVFVRAYLLKVAEKESKIDDLLLIHTKWGWTIFSDDPVLDSPVYRYYSTLKALLHAVFRRAMRPL